MAGDAGQEQCYFHLFMWPFSLDKKTGDGKFHSHYCLMLHYVSHFTMNKGES